MTPDNDQKPSLLTRRGVLRLLALTGASLAAGSETSQAFVDFFSSYQDVPREHLDEAGHSGASGFRNSAPCFPTTPTISSASSSAKCPFAR